MEKAEALWRSRIQAEKEEKEEAARRRRQAEVNGARWELVRLEQQRSPDIDPEVRPVLLFRAQNAVLAAVAAATTKACSAGCGMPKDRAAFSKKQWSARAVRRCLDCVKACVEPKLCTHGKGAFDCAACISIVTREAEAEAKAEALWQKSRAAADEEDKVNTKYAEAVSVAAEECAEDVKGQTCYICTQALHWETKEGLVRGCSCHGTEGFAHLSCLAEQAKILMDEAEENNLGDKVKLARFRRWYKCSLCEQSYHGVVACALGWACWKTYLGRPEGDLVRRMAMTLGNGLADGPRLEGIFCANCGRDNASKTCGRCMTQVYPLVDMAASEENLDAHARLHRGLLCQGVVRLDMTAQQGDLLDLRNQARYDGDSRSGGNWKSPLAGTVDDESRRRS